MAVSACQVHLHRQGIFHSCLNARSSLPFSLLSLPLSTLSWPFKLDVPSSNLTVLQNAWSTSQVINNACARHRSKCQHVVQNKGGPRMKEPRCACQGAAVPGCGCMWEWRQGWPPQTRGAWEGPPSPHISFHSWTPAQPTHGVGIRL